MAELILYAIPAFVILLVVELLSFKYARDEDLVGYEAWDTRTSLTMGGGNEMRIFHLIKSRVAAHESTKATLGLQALVAPAALVLYVEQATVEAGRAAVPELDQVGIEAEAAPVRGPAQLFAV